MFNFFISDIFKGTVINKKWLPPTNGCREKNHFLEGGGLVCFHNRSEASQGLLILQTPMPGPDRRLPEESRGVPSSKRFQLLFGPNQSRIWTSCSLLKRIWMLRARGHMVKYTTMVVDKSILSNKHVRNFNLYHSPDPWSLFCFSLVCKFLQISPFQVLLAQLHGCSPRVFGSWHWETCHEWKLGFPACPLRLNKFWATKWPQL